MKTTASLRVGTAQASRAPRTEGRRDIPPQVREARLAIKRAALAHRRALAAAEEARRRSRTARELVFQLREHEQHARLTRARVARSPDHERSIQAVTLADRRVRALREALRSAKLAAIEVRALAYRAARQTRRAMHEARRLCERVGLSEQAFRKVIGAWSPVDNVFFRTTTLA